MMGTRSGSVDPAIIGHVAGALGKPARADPRRAQQEVGPARACPACRTTCGRSRRRPPSGHERARLAFDIFCYVLAKAIAALVVPLGRLDALVFTGGIGENSVAVRATDGRAPRVPRPHDRPGRQRHARARPERPHHRGDAAAGARRADQRRAHDCHGHGGDRAPVLTAVFSPVCCGGYVAYDHPRCPGRPARRTDDRLPRPRAGPRSPGRPRRASSSRSRTARSASRRSWWRSARTSCPSTSVPIHDGRGAARGRRRPDADGARGRGRGQGRRRRRRPDRRGDEPRAGHGAREPRQRADAQGPRRRAGAGRGAAQPEPDGGGRRDRHRGARLRRAAGGAAGGLHPEPRVHRRRGAAGREPRPSGRPRAAAPTARASRRSPRWRRPTARRSRPRSCGRSPSCRAASTSRRRACSTSRRRSRRGSCFAGEIRTRRVSDVGVCADDGAERARAMRPGRAHHHARRPQRHHDGGRAQRAGRDPARRPAAHRRPRPRPARHPALPEGPRRRAAACWRSTSRATAPRRSVAEHEHRDPGRRPGPHRADDELRGRPDRPRVGEGLRPRDARAAPVAARVPAPPHRAGPRRTCSGSSCPRAPSRAPSRPRPSSRTAASPGACCSATPTRSATWPPSRA